MGVRTKGSFTKGDPRTKLGGRPKGTISITTAIKNELIKVPEGQKHTYLDLIVKRILKTAIQEGDPQMLKTLWAYIDGMPKQQTEISGDINVNFSGQDKAL